VVEISVPSDQKIAIPTSESPLIKTDIVAKATEAIFGGRLIMNVYRSVLVEAMVAEALPDWTWCSADYAAHDFIHPTGLRLEVKQTALRQSWESTSTPRPSWDIAARKGFWEGSRWVATPGRNAEVYVLALHPVTDEQADHRDPEQWQFHVIAASRLPETKRLSATAAAVLAPSVAVGGLAEAVGRLETR
jgi:hypothetical protein